MPGYGQFCPVAVAGEVFAERWTPLISRALLAQRLRHLCLTDPGFCVDLVVVADLATFTKIWLGDVSFEQAIRAAKVRLEGARDLARAFPRWLLLGHFAGVARPRAARAS